MAPSLRDMSHTSSLWQQASKVHRLVTGAVALHNRSISPWKSRRKFTPHVTSHRLRHVRLASAKHTFRKWWSGHTPQPREERTEIRRNPLVYFRYLTPVYSGTLHLLPEDESIRTMHTLRTEEYQPCTGFLLEAVTGPHHLRMTAQPIYEIVQDGH